MGAGKGRCGFSGRVMMSIIFHICYSLVRNELENILTVNNITLPKGMDGACVEMCIVSG